MANFLCMVTKGEPDISSREREHLSFCEPTSESVTALWLLSPLWLKSLIDRSPPRSFGCCSCQPSLLSMEAFLRTVDEVVPANLLNIIKGLAHGSNTLPVH